MPKIPEAHKGAKAVSCLKNFPSGPIRKQTQPEILKGKAPTPSPEWVSAVYWFPPAEGGVTLEETENGYVFKELDPNAPSKE